MKHSRFSCLGRFASVVARLVDRVAKRFRTRRDEGTCAVWDYDAVGRDERMQSLDPFGPVGTAPSNHKGPTRVDEACVPAVFLTSSAVGCRRCGRAPVGSRTSRGSCR